MVVAIVETDRYDYAVDLVQGKKPANDRWSLVRIELATGTRKVMRLDRDYRHDRLFLTSRDQRTVGLEGLMALERMARELWPRRR
jgi:hypothetical protein